VLKEDLRVMQPKFVIEVKFFAFDPKSRAYIYPKDRLYTPTVKAVCTPFYPYNN